MPSCTTCGVCFRGRGSRCALHQRHSNTWLQDHNYNNYSSDSTDPIGTHPRSAEHGRRQRTLRFAVDNEAYYIGNNALVRYNTTGNHITTTAATAAAKPLSRDLAQPLVQVFSTLTNTHAIASLNYSVNPSTGTHSLTAEANFEREQCTVCRLWFPDHQKLVYHQWELPVGCEECGICLRQEDVAWHGTGVRHERCFVRGCGSHYRREGGWKSMVVERHVRDHHA